VPLLVVTPLTFLGGSFYSIDMLPPFWRTVSAVQPGRLPRQRLPLELLRHLRRASRRQHRHDVFLAACLGVVWWIFKTGYRLKT
jgi:ABC-2 type transport system permease protein